MTIGKFCCRQLTSAVSVAVAGLTVGMLLFASADVRADVDEIETTTILCPSGNKTYLPDQARYQVLPLGVPVDKVQPM